MAKKSTGAVMIDDGSGEGPNSEVSSHGSGYPIIALAALLWSFGGLFVKYLTGTQHVAPEAVACLRSAFGGVALVWALPKVWGAPMGRVMGAGLSYTCVVGAFVMATVGTTAANAIMLQYAYPLLVAVGVVLIFKERLDKRTIFALVLGMLGVGTILISSWRPGQREGLIYGVFSAVAFASVTLFQHSIKTGSPFGFSSLYNLMAAALLLPFALGKLHLSLFALLVVAIMGIFQLALPYVFFIKGLRTVPSTDAALITLLEPVMNPVWVWLIVGETPQAWTIIGGLLILIALGVRFASVRKKT
ncbi:MAG: DMT family transporter [Armatimonadetes bacterium]|nr:DMT family transporter [Armatimonadota bacterium]